jgi:tRNA pseudouridine38-40 synthase
LPALRLGFGAGEARFAAEGLMAEADAPALHNQRVTLSYDGYGFAGFQAQDADKGRTVQQEVETALRKLHGDAFIRIEASGRTDQGVHALGQVISFRTPRPWAENELARALNSTLSRDVRAMASAQVPDDFHARRSAVSKHYRYLLDNCDTQHAVRRRYAGHTGFKLDRAAIDAVAALFMGRKDFASLRNAGTDVKTTVRTVTRSEVRWEESTMIFDVIADGFLRKMVRSMVGGLIEAGRGAVTVAQLQEALDAKDRSRWPKPAAPEGLYLVAVFY